MASRNTASRSEAGARIPQQVSEGGLRPDPVTSRDTACPQCEGRRVTKISMQLTDGSPVDFVSCHDCEHKHWAGRDGALPLDGVLTRARKPRP
ncbi:MAG: hypothetical protein QOJ32_1954 [Frankiaceae bacterium]|jgi:DNA-directed RNA polymerase subunit M/transcription elongation factor TFIIS|nr:hypothetical protein [Frankiaceae bacterium]MDQ1673957.1 hypothetical protein [Frankiaceae bacterium]